MKLSGFCIVLFTVLSVGISLATDHNRPVLEPYKLAGKRIVFPNWYFVRPGHFNWVDNEVKSVYASQTAKLNEYEVHFVSFDSPHGIRLFVEQAQREIPIIPNYKPWDKWGIRLAILIYENGKFRLWGSCNSDNPHSRDCYFESTDGINWEKPNLDLVEFEGNRNNNLLPTKVGLSVFIDPKASPDERYKTIRRTDYTAFSHENGKNIRVRI